MVTEMHLPGDGNQFTPKSEPVSELLKSIHARKTQLPNFQREWVWEPEMIRDLLVSVAYRYPAGSLLTMPIKEKTFALRAFEGVQDGDQVTPTMMILDGQQRLTSLYQALFKPDGVEVGGRTYHFYLDVEVLLSDPDGSIEIGDPKFEEALFFVVEERKTHKRVRYDGLQDVYEVTTREHELEHGAFPLSIVFDSDKYQTWKQKYLLSRSERSLDLYQANDSKWDGLVKPWLDRIRTYQFPVVELRQDMPLGAICHIFEKVNSAGVPLAVFELVTAILWAQGFHLNEEWEKTKKDLEPSFPMLDLQGTYFLQGLSLLSSLQKKRTGSDGAITCRKQDLMKLTPTEVKQYWVPLANGYRKAALFMTDIGILNERILPYSTLIVPLSVILADLLLRKKEASASAAWPKIERWYWCCVFSQRYSSAVERASAQDVEQVLAWLDGGDEPDVVRTFIFRFEALQEIRNIRNVIYKGILCLLAKNGARDFGGGAKLSSNLMYETAQDHHHIFPVAALERLQFRESVVDSIVNKTLISAAINNRIKDKYPADYVSALAETLGVSEVDARLRSHLIDPDILRRTRSVDDFREFVADRSARLQKLIEDAVGTASNTDILAND